MKHKRILGRTRIINGTKIQYLSVADKIYKVNAIDFHNLTIQAARTNLSIADIPEDEVFPVEEFGDFRVRLINGDSSDSGGMGEASGDVIDFAEWIKGHMRE